MKDILDAGQVWHGVSIRGSRNDGGNNPPIAISDAASLPQDSPPIIITVLSNDVDPEGGELTVVAASAVLGSVVINPDDTLTYTPPPGYVGTDTVTYTIEDDQAQSDTADVVITISAPTLTITVEPDNTLTVNAELGLIDITIITPAAWAGTYQANTSDLATGPVNLILPVISGTPDLGETLSAADGLWIYDTGAGTPAKSWQWRRNGVDIAGATSANYVVQAADAGTALTVVETLTDAFGARSATSAAVGNAFLPDQDGSLLGWWDASDAPTITESGGLVSAWADKAPGGGASLTQGLAPQQPQTGSRTLNSLNVIDFDGGRLLEAARSFPVSGDVAFHMVLQVDAVTNLFEAVLAVEATNDFQIDANSSTQFDGRMNMAGIGTTAALTGGPFNGALILSAVFDLTGSGTAEVFINNLSRVSTAYTVPIDSSSALHIMTNRSKNAWMDGMVGEIVITADVTNRADYHSYLAAKWGLS